MVQAQQLFAQDSAGVVAQVNGLQEQTPTGFNQNQFDALVDLVFEIGIGKFLGSHLFNKIHINPFSQNIRPLISCWRIANGKINDTMTRRRTDDINLYFTKL